MPKNMKVFFKKLLTKNNLILILIIIFAFFVRFYNFSNRVTFGPEQAISLITSGEMIKGKFSLLGQENVQRITSDGHRIFSGSLFTYSLILLQIISKFEILPITAYFAILNVLTGVILYFIVRKIYSQKASVFALVLFSFSNLMIYHSLFIWILNYLPLVGILVFYFLYKFKNYESYKYVVILGILTGVGFSLEYLYLVFALASFIILCKFAKKKLKMAITFIFSATVPNLPLLLFDLRHDFYHIRTLIRYTQDVFQGKAFSGFAYYDLLPVIPLMIMLLAVLLERLYKRRKILTVGILAGYIVLNLGSGLVSFEEPTGMPKDLSVSNIMKVAKTISREEPKNYNVTVINDFDTRGHILRYPLEFIFNSHPNGVEDYPNSTTLYVLTLKGYNFFKSTPWEISSFGADEITEIENIGKDFSVYKLIK